MIRRLTESRLIRYVIVGGFSATVEMLILIGLVEYVYVSQLLSNGIAFIITNIINYMLSRLWVFERTGNRKRVEFPVFMFFVSCGLLISQSIFWGCTTYFSIDYRMAKVISIAFVVAWNFLSRRYFIFNPQTAIFQENQVK